MLISNEFGLLAEVVQLGRIPIYLYDDIPWVPYAASPYSPAQIGVLGQYRNNISAA